VAWTSEALPWTPVLVVGFALGWLALRAYKRGRASPALLASESSGSKG
jgi:hypothetical protein